MVMKNENGRKNNPSVKPVPEGFHTVTPYLIVEDASALIEFIKNSFEGELTYIMKDDEGKVTHATLKIGNSMIMISDAMEGMKATTSMLFLYVNDTDKSYQKAVDAKGISRREPRDEFWGDRAACIEDKWGNTWWVATHIEDVSNEELKRRKDQQMSNQPA
jgi:PhnB protein